MPPMKRANDHGAGDEYATDDADGARNVDQGSDRLMISAAINDDTQGNLQCR